MFTAAKHVLLKRNKKDEWLVIEFYLTSKILELFKQKKVVTKQDI